MTVDATWCSPGSGSAVTCRGTDIPAHRKGNTSTVRVHQGWSGEIDGNVWRKVDVELEEPDLIRLLHEHRIPAEVSERLPARVAFDLLHNEAEALLLQKLTQFGYPLDKAAARIAALYEINQHTYNAIREQLAAV